MADEPEFPESASEAWISEGDARNTGQLTETAHHATHHTTHHTTDEGTRPVLTYITADINCPTCFNQVIETMIATPGVHSVDPHATAGCLAINHDLDEDALLAAITTIGHTLDVAPNGEITMGQAHAVTVHVCDAHGPNQ